MSTSVETGAQPSPVGDTDGALRSKVTRLEGDDRLYLLRFGDVFALFRIDGLIYRVSPEAFDFLHIQRGLPLEERIAGFVRQRGESAMQELAEEIIELVGSVVDDGVPQYISLVNFGKSRAPEGVLIMITQTCNLACSYCYAGGGSYGQPTKFQSTDNALTAIDQLLAASGNRRHLRVTFFGGEPLLNPALIRTIVDYCSQKGAELGKRFTYNITTNGTLVTEEIAEFLQAHGFHIMVSLDGPKEYHDKYRPTVEGQGSFDDVVRGIRLLVKAGAKIQVRATVVREMVTPEFVRQSAAEAQALGVEALNLTGVDCLRSDEATTADLELRTKETRKLLDTYAEITSENIANAGDRDYLPAFDAHRRLIHALATGKASGLSRCGACNGMAAVSTDGRMYPCHRFVGMDDYLIGDLKTGGLDSEKVEAFHQKADEANFPKCRECIARLVCGGHCFFTVADGKGGFKPPADSDCEGVRLALLRSINYVLQLESMPTEKAKAYLMGR